MTNANCSYYIFARRRGCVVPTASVVGKAFSELRVLPIFNRDSCAGGMRIIVVKHFNMQSIVFNLPVDQEVVRRGLGG